MGKWIDYKPDKGLVEKNVFDEDSGMLHVTRSEDVEGLLDRNKELQNTRATDIGIQKGFWHYASIPMTVQYELLKKGLSVFNKHHRAAILDEINANYPYLKTTTKTHSSRRRGSQKKASGPSAGPFVIVR